MTLHLNQIDELHRGDPPRHHGGFNHKRGPAMDQAHTLVLILRPTGQT